MTDIRILGRGRAFQQIEALTLDDTHRRWLLCSRDFLRQSGLPPGATVAIANPLLAETNAEGAMIYEAFPASRCFDGNRQSMMATSRNCEWVRLTLDTGVTDRKALLFLEYLDGEEVEPFEMEFTNDDPSGDSVHWNDVFSGMKAIYRFNRMSLWQLPWDTASAQSLKTIEVTGDVALTMTVGDSLSWVGAMAIPQSGINAGMVRQILAWDGVTKVVRVNSPWPVQNGVGVQLLFKKFAANFLGSRYARVKLRSRWHPNEGPINLVGMSFFDYYLELKGDMGAFRRVRAPNPMGIHVGTNATGVVHGPLLNGNVRIEQRFGPKRNVEANWGAVHRDFADFVESWAGQGMVGIVDEGGRYMQGIIQLPGWDILQQSIEASGPEVALKFGFQEV